MLYAAKMKLAEYSNIKRDQQASYEYIQTKGFVFYHRNGCSLLTVFQKPLVWTMSNSSDWNEWFNQVGITFSSEVDNSVSLSRRIGEPIIDPVKSIESKDWIKAIRKATVHDKTAFDKSLHGTGGQRNLRTLPFSEQCFQDISKKFFIHDSINSVVSRANISQFSAVKLGMGRHDGHELPAHVYSARTSNAWEGDLAVSATYFPHCRLTFAVMFGCPLSVEAEILTRLEMATYEICHPLLIPGGRSRDPESLQYITEAEKVTRKEAKRSAWLDMLYLRNQLMSWNTCLEALYEHADHLNRTTFRDISISSQLGNRSVEEFSIHGDSSSDSGADWNAPIDWLCLGNSQETNKANTDVVLADFQFGNSQKLESIRSSRGYMRRTGAKLQARLREVIKDYNEKIRECTAGFEGMAMTTQWVSHPFVFFVSFKTFANSVETQGETNVEIALATSQDSRHMRSIALLTMIFLPGTFFASIFSMGFFEWKPDDGTISVSQSFWIYVVLAPGFTAFTVGAWWYIGVYRYKRHRNIPSALSARRFLSLRPLKSLRHRVVKAIMERVNKISSPP
ncbi:unnamed protein product [Fusarium fujikuroi]|nr:unnamed protein product [Fusarium fujikuroi]